MEAEGHFILEFQDVLAKDSKKTKAFKSSLEIVEHYKSQGYSDGRLFVILFYTSFNK